MPVDAVTGLRAGGDRGPGEPIAVPPPSVPVPPGGRSAAATPSRSPSPGWPRRSSSGWWPVGERLPAERELAEQLQVSRVTLREAIGALREAGYLESRRGRCRAARSWCPPAPRAAAHGRGRPDAGDAGPRDGRRAARRARLPAGGRAGRGRAGGQPDAVGGRPAAPGRLPGRLAATATRRTRRVADSRLHLAIAAASGSPSLAAAVADVQLTPRPAAGRDPGDPAQPRPLRRPAHPRSSTRSWPATRPAPGRRWRSTATAPPSCCAVCSAELTLRYASRPFAWRSRMTARTAALTVEELRRGGRRRRDRHGRPGPRRHAGPAAGQAVPRPVLPRRGARARHRGLQLPARRRRRHEHRRRATRCRRWERGYGDFAMVPDLATLRRVPWQPGTAMLLADLRLARRRGRRASPRPGRSCAASSTGSPSTG